MGRLNVPEPVPAVVDGLMAATALVHDWTLVIRNIGDVASTGVRFLDPFTSGNRDASVRTVLTLAPMSAAASGRL